MFIESYPDELELLSFFESEPTFFDKTDRRFAYEFTDDNGIHLVFSFSVIEGWIQTVLEINGNKIAGYLSEGVKSFKVKDEINGEYIHSEIMFADTRTEVEIRLKPFISVKWGTLVR
ncbi:hypothetical protein KKJ17_11280 [Xenorhabdus bovienii]|uniref:hypothetical protein n=1 Tax=Xenorhabdus bovienii TaxID=40576 RepID=UPI00237CE7F6|nr:hypothetical protein [Xenorhabdus bovienii]MDE1475748.1 hypothetical protein [Xenorhabdus bovienii]MDE9428179.1 hypothetical protein [Xenorhabdus bovienii]MDE9431965.1 hypothetical protein [Xenorhabdus bovienii]MDE9442525.1 hypothetical protein [Xenorhabdus bovienii]MDE9458861.1 hypothetical protein [Xenorhabdus bovienii]